MLGTDFILQALVSEGLDHLFMVPGGLVDPFLPALGRQTALTPVVAAQEGGAAYMADGYARARGGLGAALCIGGPGLANTATAVAAARTDGSPVLLISGEVANDFEGRGMFQDASAETLDDVSLMRPITRFSSSVDSPANLPHLFRHAVMAARAEPCAPVHLSVPRDAQAATIDATYAGIPRSLLHGDTLSQNAAQQSLGEFTAKTARIVVLAGAGVEHADAAGMLKDFAERWTIPVATTLRAKGVFPEDHPLSLGVFGYAGTHHARAALLDHAPDLLIILGSGLNERDSMYWSLQLVPKRTICINLSAATMSDHDGTPVLGDAGAYLAFLAAQSNAIAPALEATRAARGAWLEGIRKLPRLQDPHNCQSAAVPLHPARAISALRKAFPRDGILLVDSGAHRAFAGHYWESYAPRTYISATNLGPMGWAVPAAVGVQCAAHRQRVAVITGDGCMHMQGIEVATAARYGLPILFVVLNNAALGNVWLRAHTEGPVPAELTSLPNLDWAGFGRSLGANGITVTEPAALDQAFAAALANKGPTVIDIKTDKAFGTPVADFAAAAARFSYHE